MIDPEYETVVVEGEEYTIDNVATSEEPEFEEDL